MGKLQEFSIQLDNRGCVYTSGDIVSGHVLVHLRAPMKMRGLRVTFLGRSGVNWRETKGQGGDNTNPVVIHFNAEEVYLNSRQVLWGQDSDRDFTDFMQAGRHKFPFKVFLPKDLPCSFEGDHGCINYKINATIDKPWKKDHNVKLFFTVIGMYDLNDDPHASEGIVHTASQRVCCGCCSGGSFSVRYTIDRRGFVPGEEIPLVIEVKNFSTSKLRSEVKFKMVTTYFAHDDSKKQQEELDRFSMDPVSAHSSGTLRTTIDIPPTPPSHLMGCNIIDVDYIVRLKLIPDGCNFDSIEFHDEILVGTVPLRHVIAKMLGDGALVDALMGPGAPGIGVTQTVTSDDGAPASSGASPTGAQTPDDDDIAFPAPVYAKGRKGSVMDDDDHKLTGESFTPQYTFYNWKQMLVKLQEQQEPAHARGPPEDQVIPRGFADVVEDAVTQRNKVTASAAGVFMKRSLKSRTSMKKAEEMKVLEEGKELTEAHEGAGEHPVDAAPQRTVSFAEEVEVVDEKVPESSSQETTASGSNNGAQCSDVTVAKNETASDTATNEYLKLYRLSDPNRDDDVHPMLQGRFSTYC